MNTNLKLSLVAICSAALTAGVLLSLPSEHSMPTDSKASSKKEPLYWVALECARHRLPHWFSAHQYRPIYRRDRPFISPD